MLVSVIIRTLNESRYLGELLRAINSQVCTAEVETIVVDSGSTDGTQEIATQLGANLVNIGKDEFTFGRSLNKGCETARGDMLAFVSGHCVPVGTGWLASLIQPLVNEEATYAYGRQIGRDSTPFSEHLVFRKYYPEDGSGSQQEFFCNNANAAIRRSAWQHFKFNENLTGLEDMYLAKQLVIAGHRVAYCADASVYHIHSENWRQVKRRYQREAIALKEIMPEVYMSLGDLVICIVSSISSDVREMARQGRVKPLGEIVMYRVCQYLGSYLGSHEHRKLTREMKKRYFYPNDQRE